MADHLHPIIAACHAIAADAYALQHLAAAFEATGNRAMSDRLEGFASRLTHSVDRIRSAHEQPSLPQPPPALSPEATPDAR